MDIRKLRIKMQNAGLHIKMQRFASVLFEISSVIFDIRLLRRTYPLWLKKVNMFTIGRGRW